MTTVQKILIFVGLVLAGAGILYLMLPRTIAGRMLFLRLGLGIVFFMLGIIGSFLPVLQGWLFFLISFLLFFPQNRWSTRILQKAEPKVPRVVALLRRLGIGTP